MDNKEFPEQEDLLPQEQPEAPAQSQENEEQDPPLQQEEMPVIIDLSMTEEADAKPISLPEEPEEAPEEASVPEELPEEPSAPEESADESIVHGEPAEESTVPEEAVPEQMPPLRDGAEFMSRIPDVDAEESNPEPSAPEEPEAPIDLSILDDPELNEVLAEPEAPAPVDQEYRDDSGDFDTIFHAPAPEASSAGHDRPTRKGRPKRKRGEGLFGIPNILATFVWLALILIIGVTAGRMLWVCAADVLAFGREDRPVTITIYEADTMEDIVDKLYDNGLIRYKSLFNLYASISDAEEDIKPGIYDLNTRYDYHALVNFMSPRSSREVVELTIPEGYTCQQIFALLEENRVCTAVDAAAYAATGELDDYWFLEGLERGSENCLEGYLFPDTYEFYKNSTPREALQRMLNNFEIKFTEEMLAQLDVLNANLTGDYTVREIVIVASLIEKESAAPGESPNVAGVIYNRLFRWGDNPKRLDIDAAIVYAQGGDAENIDTSIDHPYNTYRNPGLTPGPISNPGLASLKAALNPETHGYYYYVLNPSTGMHQFSSTYEEHNAWIDQFYG